MTDTLTQFEFSSRERMPKKPCCKCGACVDGHSARGIPLQFYCLRCYKEVPEEVSASEARSRFGCTSEDFEILNGRDPSNGKRTGRQVYLRVEAEYLGRLRKGKQQWEERHKRKASQQALMEKRQRLENSTHVKLLHIREDLRPFVIGDYLTKQRGTRMTLKTVQARVVVHRRAEKIMDACRTDPMTAIDFCVDYPMWGPAEFIDLRERLRKVFRLEGTRILHKIPPAERNRLGGTPLSDVYAAFSERNSHQYVLHYLKRSMSEEKADEILADPACQVALQKGGNEEEVAKKLQEFWNEKNDVKKRKAKLEAALKHHQLSMPADQKHYQDYVSGKVCRDLDELIAVAEFAERLKKRGFHPWENRFAHLHKVIFNCMNENRMSVDESVNVAMKKVPPRPF